MVRDSRFQNGRLTGGSSHGAGKQGVEEVKRESLGELLIIDRFQVWIRKYKGEGDLLHS